jgi:hypothetical protein
LKNIAACQDVVYLGILMRCAWYAALILTVTLDPKEISNEGNSDCRCA